MRALLRAYLGERIAYQKVLIERVVYYPAPQPSEQVSMEALNAIRDYGESGG